jgi:hypothetical protein
VHRANYGYAVAVGRRLEPGLSVTESAQNAHENGLSCKSVRPVTGPGDSPGGPSDGEPWRFRQIFTTPVKPAFTAARWGGGFGAGVAVGGGRYWAPGEVTPFPAAVSPRTKVCRYGGWCPSLLSVLAIRNNWRAHAGLGFRHGDTEDTERCAVFRQRQGRDGVLAVRWNTGAEDCAPSGGRWPITLISVAHI